MAGKSRYLRGILIFFVISFGTFLLMYLFGEDASSRVPLVWQADRDSKASFAQALAVPQPVTIPATGSSAAISLKGLTNAIWSWSEATNAARDAASLAASGRAMAGLVLRSQSNLIVAEFATAPNVCTNAPIRAVFTATNDAQAPARLARFVADLAVMLPLPSQLGLMESIGEISLWFLLIALAFYFINVLVDSYLVRVLLRAIDDDMPFMQCIYAVLGNEFLTAITPFQSGGQPLMVYVMHKNNVSVGKGILIVFFKTAAQIYFFALAAPVVILFWPEVAAIPGLAAFYVYGIIFFGYFLVLTFLVLVKPHKAKRISMWFFKLLGKFKYFKKRKAKMSRGLRKTIREINIFSHFTKNILRTKKIVFLKLFSLTILSWIFKFLVAVAVIWGLGGLTVNVIQAVSVQTVTNFLGFFAPSPGGSGVFEFSMKKVFETVEALTPERLFVFVIIWRFITYYISVFLGGLVAVRVLHFREHELEEEEKIIEHEIDEARSLD